MARRYWRTDQAFPPTGKRPIQPETTTIITHLQGAAFEFFQCGAQGGQVRRRARGADRLTGGDRCTGRRTRRGLGLGRRGRGRLGLQGYFSDEEATAAVFTPDGWLNTGDMGYLVDGELVITGRSKDLIICNGCSIWPQDLEWAVELRCGMSPGHVAAFSVDDEDGKEQVVVVVETRTKDSEVQRDLRRQVSAVIMTVAGVGGEIVLAPPRSLTFTSSGKLSRAAAKADVLSGAIEDIATDAAGW